jgi:putative FmdB family regulatory protein
MPIYEYACRKCGKDFEVLVAADQTAVCTSCGSSQLRRKLSLFAVNNAASRQSAAPGCAGGCGGGFEQGCCGSGMCGGHQH